MPATPETTRLPLFPLNTVLFPGMPLPLRIFEPRYRQLLADCLENDRRFGVCLIRQGQEVGGPAEPFRVGTVAEIVLVETRDGGHSDLLTVGRQRFRLNEIVEREPYLVGEVELLTLEPSAAVPTNLIKEMTASLRDYVDHMFRLSGRPSQEYHLPEDPALLPFFAGLVLQVSTHDRQELLEFDDLVDRLEWAQRHLAVARESLNPKRFDIQKCIDSIPWN